jgi:hypothetical protein
MSNIVELFFLYLYGGFKCRKNQAPGLVSGCLTEITYFDFLKGLYIECVSVFSFIDAKIRTLTHPHKFGCIMIVLFCIMNTFGRKRDTNGCAKVKNVYRSCIFWGTEDVESAFFVIFAQPTYYQPQRT